MNWTCKHTPAKEVEPMLVTAQHLALLGGAVCDGAHQQLLISGVAQVRFAGADKPLAVVALCLVIAARRTHQLDRACEMQYQDTQHEGNDFVACRGSSCYRNVNVSLREIQRRC